MCLYKRADRDKDGEVNIREFAKTFDVEIGNPFLQRLVRLFDVSGDGVLSPFEFIVCLSQFGNKGRNNEHVYFAWRLFDLNGDGWITKNEFREVLGATYFRANDGSSTVGNNPNENRKGVPQRGGQFSHRKIVGDGGMRKGRGLANFGGVGGLAKGLDGILKDVDGDKDGKISITEFKELTKKYQHVMAPAFDLWMKLAEVAAPALLLRAEIKRKGNEKKLVALAMKSSGERRVEVKSPVVGDGRTTGNMFITRNVSGASDDMAAFREADPGERNRGGRGRTQRDADQHDYDENTEEDARLNRFIDTYDAYNAGAGRGIENGKTKNERSRHENEADRRRNVAVRDAARLADKHRQRRYERGHEHRNDNSKRYAPGNDDTLDSRLRTLVDEEKRNAQNAFRKKKSTSWRLPSFSSLKLKPPPKTEFELEMERACAFSDDE